MKNILYILLFLTLIKSYGQGAFQADGRFAPTGTYFITKFGEAQTGFYPLSRYTQKDSIPTWQRFYGMIVYAADRDSCYQLKSVSLDNTNWFAFKLKNYLSSYTETDPIYTASSWYGTANNSSNWNTAFGWGDWHSTLLPKWDSATAKSYISANYYSKTQSDARFKAIGYVPDWSEITSKPSNFSTTYALSNDIKDSIQRRWDSATVKAKYYSKTETDASLSLKYNISDTTNKWIGYGWLSSLMKYSDTTGKWLAQSWLPYLAKYSDTTSTLLTQYKAGQTYGALAGNNTWSGLNNYTDTLTNTSPSILKGIGNLSDAIYWGTYGDTTGATLNTDPILIKRKDIAADLSSLNIYIGDNGSGDTIPQPSTGLTDYILFRARDATTYYNIHHLFGSDGTAQHGSYVTAKGFIKRGIDTTHILLAGGGDIPQSTFLTPSTGVASITGTTNQVIASASTGNVTLSLPQNIATTSKPTFSGAIFSDSTSHAKGISIGGGYTYPAGELGFSNTSSGQQYGIYDLGTGSPNMIFDHRGTSNTGSWTWRNGTGGANTLMQLSPIGILTIPYLTLTSLTSGSSTDSVVTIDGSGVIKRRNINSLTVGNTTGINGASVPTTSTILGSNSSGQLISQSAATIQSYLGLGSNAYTSTAYLPLSGGTLTGALSGTSATFSSSLSLNQNGNLSTSYGLYGKRNTDTSPLGYLIMMQNAAANTNLFTVDVNGSITAPTATLTAIPKYTSGGYSLLLKNTTTNNVEYGDSSALISLPQSGQYNFVATDSVNAQVVAFSQVPLAYIINGNSQTGSCTVSGKIRVGTTATGAYSFSIHLPSYISGIIQNGAGTLTSTNGYSAGYVSVGATTPNTITFNGTSTTTSNFLIYFTATFYYFTP